MMRFESLREGFAVHLGDGPVLVHSQGTPCLSVADRPLLRWSERSGGSGRWLLKSSPRFVPLRGFRLLESSPDRVAINFEGRVGLELDATGDILSLRILAGEQPGALRLRLVGFIGERVFGGGSDASSRLDIGRQRLEFWGGDARSAEGRRGQPRRRPWPVLAFIASNHRWIRVDSPGWSAADFRAKDRVTLDFSSLPDLVQLGVSPTSAGALGSLSRASGAAPLPPAWSRTGPILSFAGNVRELERRLERLEEVGLRVAAVRLADVNLLDADAIDGRKGGEGCLSFLRSRGLRALALARPSLERDGQAWRDARDAGVLLGHGSDPRAEAVLDLEALEAAAWSVARLSSAIAAGGIEGLRLEIGPPSPGSAEPERSALALKANNLRPLVWSRIVREAVEVAGRRSGDFLLSSLYGWGVSGCEYSGIVDGRAESIVGLSSRIGALIARGFSGAGLAWLDPTLPLPPRGRDPAGSRPAEGRGRARERSRLRAIELSAFGPVMEFGGADILETGPAEVRFLARMAAVFSALEPYHARVVADCRDSFIPPHVHAWIFYESGFPDSGSYGPGSYGQGSTGIRFSGARFSGARSSGQGSNGPRSYGSSPAYPGPPNQFMYGRDLLVATPTREGEFVDLELPVDDWIHLWSSRHFRGGPVGIEAPLGAPAVFFRAESAFAGLFDDIRRAVRRM